MKRSDRPLFEIGLAHYGLITRAQAQQAGLSDELISARQRRGLLRVVGRGVYRISGFPESWRSKVLQAVLLGGPTAVASHGTAAALHRLDGFGEGRLEITVDRDVSRRPGGAIVHRHRAPLREMDRDVVDAIPCTSICRTLVDVAQVRGIQRAEIALDGAERDTTVQSVDVHERAEDLRGRGHTRVGTFSETARARIGRSQPTSYLERLALRAIEDHGLPRPVCQHPIVTAGRRFRADFAYPTSWVAIELDGRVGHADDLGRQRDAERDTYLRLAGWAVLRFTYRDVNERPEWMVQRIREALFGDGRRAREIPNWAV